MIKLAAVLIVLVVACLVTVGYPVFAQGPPEQESSGVSSPGKSDSNISQLLLDSINQRGGTATLPEAGTKDTVAQDAGTRDAGVGGRSASGGSGSSGTGGREELLSGVSKDDSETSRTAGDLVRFDGSGNVEVYIHLQSTDEASLQQVRDAVEKVEIEGAEYGLLQAWVDPDNLGAVASLEAVKRITSPDYGYTKKGSTLTEGDAVHRANLVRAFSGLSGEGVKVGVISNGVDAWTSARSRGDLPSRIEINPNQDSEGHEGTALLEIIHDIAPDAELAFSGSESSLGMAQAILWLANGAFDGEGADVIVDDLGYFLQPFFEDGIIAQAAADAVAGGAVFASAAGNYAQEHYEGDFVDGGDSFHAFDGSSDITMRLFSPFGAFVILQWNDEFGASGNDYDLYICPAGLTPTTFNLFNGICDASTDLQNGNDDPLEVASLYVEGEVDVFIKKDSGQNRRLEMFFIDSYAREYGVEEGGIVHHVAVPGVLAVGAVDADDPGNDDLRSYSDLGPSRIYFPSLETRQKPDVVASDGVSVTGSGGFRSHFNGTSAAAPHVAGIAALLIEAQRLADSTMTKKQVADAVTQKIRDTAIDLGPSGHDNKFGYGRADALAGVESLDQLSATTFTVNSTGDGADSNTRDGVCDDGNGNCTLRAAIQEANRVDGSFIEFNISGGGTRTIQPASSLPTITRTVLIDGFSQSGASSSNYRIELDGTNAGTNSNGLTISGTETWVRGLVINRFGGNGIVLQGSGGKQVIEENRIGTNASGSSDSGNGKAGVLVSGADGVELRNNLNSGNDGHGVELSGGADDVIIDGNIIGANVSGTSDLGNTGSGIHISNGDGAKIANNVIAGNDSHGVSLTGSSTYDNVVAENYIGVNESGASIANSGSGVHIGNGADDNTVEHNTIAHNTGDGATVVSSSATGNTVWENSMYSNGGLGIDLGDKGVTANDANDRDSGPNNLQNYAVLTSAGLSSDAGSIGFNLYVTQGNRYTVDFYASDSCDGSGNGEGKEWLGFARVVLATFGDRHFVVNTFRGTLNQYDYPSGTYITATVTLDGSTSEFSPCVQRTALPRLALSEDAIEVEEDGTTTTTYTVRLSSRPSHDATVDLTIQGDEAVTVSPTPLTFTTSNWDNTQTVTVTAVSDDDPEDEFTVIQHKMTIDSKQYVSEWLPVTVVDYDVPDVALVLGGTNRLTGFVRMEEGQSATYPVVLTAEPDDDVTVSIYSSSSSALRVSTSSLTFTKDNYDTAQNVTITARNDSDAEDELVNVYHEVLIDGSYYEVARVTAFITDPIFPALTLSDDTLSVNEGETNTYTIVPATEPSRNFTITLESSDTDSVTVSPPTVIFTQGTNGNWQTPKTITVTGVQDDDEFDDVALIRHLSTYSGIEYRLGSGVEVTVADGNRAPFFEEGVKTNRTIDENSSQGAAVGDPVVATDLNNDTLTYTLEIVIGGPYSIDSSGQITLGAGLNLDYEASSDQGVKVTATDPGGLSDTIEVEIEIANVNEPPVVTGLSGAEDTEFQENRTGTVGRFRATDPERDSFEWDLIGRDRTFFSIDSRGYLTFIEPPDFEDKVDADGDGIYEPTVAARDTAGQFGTLDIKVTVTNVNEPPTVTGRDSFSVDENNDTFSESFTASDPEGVIITFTWSLSGTDRGDFEISSTGALTFKDVPDYERPADSGGNNEYNVQLRANDGSLTGTKNITVTVNDVNEPPTITGDDDPSYPENGTRSVASYRAMDPEGSDITWSLSGADAGDFDISASGVLTFQNSPDFENPDDANRDNDYLVTVEARDDGFNTASLEVVVTVSNSSGTEEPSITTTSRPVLTYQENGTGTVYTYSARDPQGRPIDWSVTGTDRSSFTITSDSSGRGVLTFRSPPDFENPTDSNRDNVYEITVVATDEQRLTDSFDVTVIVTNHHESLEPAITTGPSSGLTYQQLNYQENRTSTVYTYRATNYGSGAISWSLSGTDAGDFTITSDISGRGLLTFASTPDFEAPDDLDDDDDYEITVVVTNAGGYTDRLDVVVTVTDVNEGPVISLMGNAPGSVPENQDQMQLLARYRATDPEDPSAVITRWSTSGTDGGDFVMNEQGELRFRYVPDYERPADSNRDNEYNFSVRASDGRYYGYHEVTVTVTPVNEPPTITTTSVSATGLRQSENRTTRLYSYRATDPEGSAVTWSVGGAADSFFTINERGEFSFNETSPPDYEQPGDSGRDNVYDLTVQARDAEFNTETLDITVTVTDVNEGPEVTGGGDSFNVQENRQWSGASFTAVDPEQGTVTRWSLGGRDGSDFTISENGAMTFRRVPDYERPDDSDQDNVYEVEIRPYDGRYYGSHDVTVTVGDVNEITGPATLSRSENFEGVLAIYRATGRGDLIVEPTWRLTGTDGGDFTISEGGELTFRSIPDHERPADSNRDNEYLFTVQASDDRYYGTVEVTVTVSPVNEPPTITTTSSSATVLRQSENRTSRLYTYRATDPEGGSTIRWSVGGTDRNFFAINERGEFSFATTSSPDFEQPGDAGGNNVYNVTMQVSDDSVPPNTASLPVTVTVTDVNEGPEITSGGTGFTVEENQDWAGETFTASDPEQGTVTRWNLGGRDGGDFTISETGLMTFRSIPDYESPADSDRNNIYEVEVRPYDGRYYGSHHVTVTVTPINEAPDITTTGTSATSLSHPENRTTRLYAYRATDPENRSIRWAVTGTHARFFTINDRGELFFSETDPPDYENRQGTGSEGNEYQVTIEASDGTLSGTLDVTVTVTDVNEGPEISRSGNLFGNPPGSVPENQYQETVLGRYTATDPEDTTAQITRWSTSGRDGGDFVINEQGELRFRKTPDHERAADSDRNNVYELTIRASDGRNYGSFEETVTVIPVNEAPTITTTSTSATSLRQAENRTTRLYTYRATDPENRAIRWSVTGTHARFFNINESGELFYSQTNPPDYENRQGTGSEGNEYQVTIQASDGALSDTLTVTVTLTDVNEGPEITRVGNLQGSVPENQAQDTVLARYGATDPEGLVSPITRWSTSGRDGGDFVISEQGELRFRNSPDFERPADSDRDNVYEVTIGASDGRYTGTLEETQIVTVTPINEAPDITTTSRTAFTQPESRNSALYTFRATDPEGATITWSPGGVDGSFFIINERGALFFTDPPDFEARADSGRDNVYDVTVQASDGSLPDFLVVTVTVTDANEGPEITRIGNLQGNVPENQAQDIVLARYNATDPEDTTATITRWSTSGRDGGDFVISEQGELQFRNSPDFERPADSDRDNVYEVTVRASDGRYTGTLEESQVITVTNVNETPVITTKSRTEFTQRENTAAVLYTYRATDPDRNDVIRWSVEGADGEDFAIFGGVLTFRRLPDFEEPADSGGDNEYNVTIVAADQGGLQDSVDATITITEVNEGPKVSGITSFTVAEGQDLIGASFTANDQEGDAVTRWSLSGSDGSDFEISETGVLETGVLTFRNTPDYDSPADSNRDNKYLVTVRAYDSGNRYGTLDVTVTVTDVNEEAPVVTGRDSLSFRENTTTETRLYTYRATDSDRNTTFSWSVRGLNGNNDGNTFDISDTGVLTFSSEPNYEQPADTARDNVYEITVVASDGSNEGTFDVTVTVTEVNEGPEISGTDTYTIPETRENLASATFTAVDPEGDTVTSWRLAGTDSGDFTITDSIEQTGRNTADLTFRNPPDVDRPADSNRDNEYLVSIRAYDNRGRYGSYEVTVTVTGANEPPVITGSDARSFTENRTGTIYTYRATDPERDDFSWIAPGGTHGHLFEVSDRGALTFKDPPDYDSRAGSGADGNDYLVTVQARDDQGNTGTFDVTVTVNDVNEGPEITRTGANTDITVQEYTDPNQDPALQILATYSARDPEGSDIARWSPAGSDGGDFVISDNGELTFRYAPDYDSPADSNRDNEYLVIVRAYDATNRYGSLDVTVTVRGENEADPVVTGNQTMSFRENTATTTRLYTYRASDADRNTMIAWSVRGPDGGDFDIGRAYGVLTFKEEPDYEIPADSDSNNEYLVTVVATDDEGREGTLDVTVTVTEVEEGPEITGATTHSVIEGLALSNATFNASDPDPGDANAAVTGWRLVGTDAGDFNIGPTGTNSAQLTFRNTPDYDSPADSNRDNEYLVTIRAYNGSTYGSLDVKVTVTDQNEAAPVVSGRETLSFSENYERTLYTYRATDMDRDTTIVWLLEGDDRDDFEIAEGVLTFKEEPDYEDSDDANDDNVYEITVVASDGTNHGTLDVTITVTDVNEGPEVAGQATRTVSEDFDQVLATYTGKDPEDTTADITRWSVIGRDGGDFTINEDGELTFRNPPDFERPADANRDNEYEVTVRASDGRYYGAYDVTVAVEDVNEAPEFRSGSRDSFTYRENGTSALYTYRATDPEGDDFTWSVGGTDGGDFEINEDGGVLTFRTPPDFDNPADDDEDNEYLVTVIARDDRLNAAELEVRVTVTELNEGPVIQESPANTEITVRENSEGVLFTYSATDPEDPDAEITRWSVTGTDGGDFTINEDGELTFRSTPDFERPADSNRDNEYLVTVRASDGRYYGTLEVTVMVEAVDEAPEFWSGSTTQFAYQENGTSDLYTYRATDPEGNNVTWGLSGDDSSAFTISETGVLAFNDPPDYEAPADDGEDNVYQVTVVARDEQNNDRNLEVTVTVTNVTD